MRIGDRVLFGRPNGEQSLGEVIKGNLKCVKVRLLESRGDGRGSVSGSVWSVDKSFCRHANTGEQSAPVTVSESVLERALAKLTHEERTAVAMFYRSRTIT